MDTFHFGRSNSFAGTNVFSGPFRKVWNNTLEAAAGRCKIDIFLIYYLLPFDYEYTYVVFIIDGITCTRTSIALRPAGVCPYVNIKREALTSVTMTRPYDRGRLMGLNFGVIGVRGSFAKGEFTGVYRR